ncbi:beta-ketoacyl-[acyl-carrier-protein] synthase family protein [Stratiformator vulcanicus]|nr:beta-ketoacyl synthase N-terminal-like domain-containing protein [Stratiformator vulcanicus]
MPNTSSESSIVVTGLGLVGPLGLTADEYGQHLLAGESGIRRTDLIKGLAAPENVGGQAWGFDDSVTKTVMPKKQRKFVRVMCREIESGVVSALNAVEHAGLNLDEMDRSRIGVDFGANLMFSPPDVLLDACVKCSDENGDFDYDQWGTTGLNVMEPLWLLKYLPNMPACHISIALDARGPSNSLTLDEVSGINAISEACSIIRRGRADVMIAGVTGTRLHPVKSMHVALWDDLAQYDSPPETWCRPFDQSRKGQVVGEGAGTLILERRDHAEARGAEILAEVLGTGSSCVMDRSGKGDMVKSLTNAIRAALSAAGIAPDELGHVNANAGGSPSGDAAEAEALHQSLGAKAADIPVTALKSYFGSSGAGCGVYELAGSILAGRQGVIPKTLNYESGDSTFPLNVVHGEHASAGSKLFLKTNVTRIGQAAAVVFKTA